MSIDNQIEPPQSFMAMYATPGSSRPNAPQEVVLARYELCEDMASLLTEQAGVIAFKEGLGEKDILLRCHRGLREDPQGLSEREAVWVIQRVAELLEWPPLEFEAP